MPLSPEQPLNALIPMIVALGNDNEPVKPVQPLNAILPIVVTLGNDKLVKPVQPLNASSPMVVRLLGTVRLVSSVLRKKA